MTAGPAAGTTWRPLAAARGKAVFTIPPHLAFVDALARGILDDTGPDPLALAAVTVLLPTRRACRALREAFLRLSGGRPLLLPRLLPLSDVDEEEILFSGFAAAEMTPAIPPGIAPLKRQLLLTRLIQGLPTRPSPEQAAALAAELARFLDQVQTERLSFDRLKDLAPEQYAEHWQVTLRFLEILTDNWPEILQAQGCIDPAVHRDRVFADQATAWRQGRAPGPVIAAGSTGSIPATADLLATVAVLDGGCVVLPGLDTMLDDESWAALDDAHPQFGLKHLLAHIGLERADVMDWPVRGVVPQAEAAARTRLVSECMRPAATTEAWRRLSGFDAAAVMGLTRLDCPGPREEAEAIALIMREALVAPVATCALVTPDRDLAERVAGELARWAIDIDDSAGRPLEATPPGVFLRLVAAMAGAAFAPVALLAACKHPLAAAGLDPAVFRDLTRRAEVALLRGPTPAPGLAALRRLIEDAPSGRKELTRWLDRLQKCCGAFAALMAGAAAPLSRLLNAHMEAAEALAASDDMPGPLRLWAHEAGETAAAFMAELADSADVLAPVPPAAYLGLLEALMAGRVVRPRYGKHPRLAILGPLEARLQRYDILILGGLNEGTWPGTAAADPWMSRPMRQAFGLPLPERRIGLAAHDIAQAMCAPRVVMTRAAKVEGTPTVPSRWLRRLERVVEAAGLAAVFADESRAWLSWARQLTRPAQVRAAPPPAPTPPVPARPRRLSVTEIEKWMRDPYAIYARHVLSLKALDPLEMDAGAADYGALVHQALHDFVAMHPAGPLPADAEQRLIEAGERNFAQVQMRPGVMAFWWPRFLRVAAWFIGHETEQRATLDKSYVEIKGELKLTGPAGPFTLTAKADRIDRDKDGRLALIDYKTGKPPSPAEVAAGFAPQLPLEAAIAAAGGFADIPGGAITELSYWHLHGRSDGGAVKIIGDDPGALAMQAREGLMNLVAAYDDPATPYPARPNPAVAPAYSDYLHLARVKEWSSGGGEGDEP